MIINDECFVSLVPVTNGVDVSVTFSRDGDSKVGFLSFDACSDGKIVSNMFSIKAKGDDVGEVLNNIKKKLAGVVDCFMPKEISAEEDEEITEPAQSTSKKKKSATRQ